MRVYDSYSPNERTHIVATVDKAKNKAQEAKGHVKEAAGKVTNDKSLEAEGKGDKTKGKLEAGRRKGEGRVQEVGVPSLAFCLRSAAQRELGSAQLAPHSPDEPDWRSEGCMPMSGTPAPPCALSAQHAESMNTPTTAVRRANPFMLTDIGYASCVTLSLRRSQTLEFDLPGCSSIGGVCVPGSRR